MPFHASSVKNFGRLQMQPRRKEAGMQIQTHHQAGTGPVSAAGRTSSVARTHRRIGPVTVAAAVACAALAIATLAFFMWGSAGIPAAHPAAGGAARTSNSDAVRSLRLDTTVAWVDGLTSGLILSSDVTSRLAAQDSKMAKVVMAAWSDLDPSSGRIRVEKTLGWIDGDGLAAGLILPSDVTSRLAAQDPRMAKAVLAISSDLNR
jgi:hypothetical protein